MGLRLILPGKCCARLKSVACDCPPLLLFIFSWKVRGSELDTVRKDMDLGVKDAYQLKRKEKNI
jgi:hypothetical protein